MLILTKYLLLSSALLLSWLLNIYNIFYLILDVAEYTMSVISNRFTELVLAGIILVGVHKILKVSKNFIKILRTKNNLDPELISVISQNNKKLAKNISYDNTVYLTNYKYTGNVLYFVHLLNSLFIYYRDPINNFFLIIALMQVYLYQDYRTLIPVTIFSLLAMIQYINQIYDIIKQQNMINNKIIPNKNCKQSQLQRGDIITLTEKDNIPADILILSNNNIIVNELQLTGENIDIKKKNLNLETGLINLTINHYQNTGTINDTNYNYDNIIFRGTKLIDGPVTGIIIETGNDCQMYKTKNNFNKNKTNTEILIDNICKRNLMLLVMLVLVCGTVIVDKQINTNRIQVMSSIMLLFNTLIPLSIQFFYNTASVLISRRLSKKLNIKINSSGYKAFQYTPDVIVTDKTGTLTCNKLELDTYYTEYYLDILDKYINVLACCDINLHSITNKILKSDQLEEELINYFNNTCKIISNNNNIINFKINNEIFTIEKLYYHSFLYNYGVKVAVIKFNDEYMLHIQGMPEYISKYLSDNTKFNIKLIELEQTPDNANYYMRVIAHTSKNITQEQAYELINNNNIEKHLTKFECPSIYSFRDYIVPDLKEIITNLNKEITMLTGDKLSSAIQVGKVTGIIDKYKTINCVEDLSNIKNNDNIIISGNLLESLVANNKLPNINNNKIIYRASPNTKQLYVSYLQEKLNKQVMMVGDGMNDISAIMKADIGVAVVGENKLTQDIADLVIDSWAKIPKVLDSFQKSLPLITNICYWIIMKHMLSAFTLFGMLLSSYYEQIRDPANPLLMSGLNGILFLYMIKFVNYSQTNIITTYWYEKGIVLGLINGLYVFHITDYSDGIYLAVASIFLQLIIKMMLFDDNSIINKLYYTVTSSLILYLIYIVSNLSYSLYLEYMLFSILSYGIIARYFI